MEHDGAKVRENLRTMMSCFYVRERSDRERAEVIEAYANTLAHLPTWAALQGIDAALAEAERYRPTPGRIRKLALAAMDPLQQELARRHEQEARQLAREAEAAREAEKPTEAQRDAILAANGFTRSRFEAAAAGKRRRHAAFTDAAERERS